MNDQAGEEEYLSPREAAERYQLSAATLALRLRRGEIPGHKMWGAAGREWRVARTALEEFGYRRREATEARLPDVAALEKTINALRRALAHERKRASEADGRLGEAMMEIARLRAALARERAEAAGQVVHLPEPSAADPLLRP